MKIKFLTLNIEHGGKLMDNILEFLDKQKPDILFMQEVYNSKDSSLERRFRTVEVIKDRVGELLSYNDFKGYAYDPGVKADIGNAIFSKFPIKKTDNYFFDVPYGEIHFGGEHDPLRVPRALQYVNLDLGGAEMNLFNIHGIWGYDGDDNPRRDKMGDGVIKHIIGKKNVIFAGDMNLDPNTNFVKRIKKDLGLNSVFGISLVSTFNMKHKTNPVYAAAAVDMIFASKNLNVVDKYMPPDDVSDHRPLVAILEI